MPSSAIGPKPQMKGTSKVASIDSERMALRRKSGEIDSVMTTVSLVRLWGISISTSFWLMFILRSLKPTELLKYFKNMSRSPEVNLGIGSGLRWKFG